MLRLPVSTFVAASLLLQLGALPPVYGQGTDETCPRRVHEIGLYGRYESDIAVLDYLIVDLQKRADVSLYVVSFGEPGRLPGAQFRLAQMCWNYVVKLKGFPPERVVTLHARDGVGLRAEIWVGRQAPDVRVMNLPSIPREQLPLRYDTYDAAFSGELSWVQEEDVQARLSTFASVLKANPHLRGEVVGFAGTSKGFLGERISGAALARRETDALAQQFGIARNRLRARSGGTKAVATIELWLHPARPSN